MKKEFKCNIYMNKTFIYYHLTILSFLKVEYNLLYIKDIIK